MKISICTTNYNCGHALDRHLSSVYQLLQGLEFEYLVVDNLSRDTSLSILQRWASNHPNMTVVSKRCTMGEGRQIAFLLSKGSHVMVLDTDVVYSPVLRRFVDAYFARFAHLSVQALFCGVFPRDQWISAGGRRSLNTNEDVDLWARLLKLGVMRWFPVATGTNLKESTALGSSDYLSNRYTKRERVLRLLRREWDFLKTRGIQKMDLSVIIAANTIDLGLGIAPGRWPQARRRQSGSQRAVGFVRELKRALIQP